MSPNDLATKFLTKLPDLLSAHSKHYSLAASFEASKAQYATFVKMGRADAETKKKREEQQAKQQATVDAAKTDLETSLATYKEDVVAACKEMAASGRVNNEELATKAELNAMQHQIQRLLSRDQERKGAVEALNVQVTGISGALTNRTERLRTLEIDLADTHKLATTTSGALTKRSLRIGVLEDEQKEILDRLSDVERESATSSEELKPIKERLDAAEKEVKIAGHNAKSAKQATTSIEKEMADLRGDSQTQVLGLAKDIAAFKGLNVDRLKHMPAEIEALKIEMEAKMTGSTNAKLVQDLKDEVAVQMTAVSELVSDLEAKMIKNLEAYAKKLDEATKRMNELQMPPPASLAPSLPPPTTLPRAQSVEATATKTARQPLPHLPQEQHQEQLRADFRELQNAVKDHARLLEDGFTDEAGMQHASLIERMMAIEQRLEELAEVETNVWQRLDEQRGMIKDLRRGMSVGETPAPGVSAAVGAASVRSEDGARADLQEEEIKELRERVEAAEKYRERIEALEKYRADVEKTLHSSAPMDDQEQGGLVHRVQTLETRYLKLGKGWVEQAKGIANLQAFDTQTTARMDGLRKDWFELLNAITSLQAFQKQGTERLDDLHKDISILKVTPTTTTPSTSASLPPSYAKDMEQVATTVELVARIAEDIKSLAASTSGMIGEQARMNGEINELKARPVSQAATLDTNAKQAMKAELKAELIAEVNPAIIEVSNKCTVMRNSLMTVSNDTKLLDGKIEKAVAHWEGVDKVRRHALQTLDQRYDALTTANLANAILEQMRPKVLAARDERLEAFRVTVVQQVQALQAALEASIHTVQERVVRIENAEPNANAAGTITSAELERRLEAWGPEAEARIVTNFNQQWAEEFKKRLDDDLMPELGRLFKEIDETRIRVETMEKAGSTAAFTSLQRETAEVRQTLRGVEESVSSAMAQNSNADLPVAVTLLQTEMTTLRDRLTDLETIRVATSTASPGPQVHEDRLRTFRANGEDPMREDDLSIRGPAGKAAPRVSRNTGGPVRKQDHGRADPRALIERVEQRGERDSSESQSQGQSQRGTPRSTSRKKKGGEV
jgi:hypothetical protein